MNRAMRRHIYFRTPPSLRAYWLAPSLRIRVQRWPIHRRDWTAPPIRIVLLSDFHLSEPSMGLRRLRQVVTRTNAIAPDLILLGGDFAKAARPVTRHVDFADAAACLAGLTAR